MFSCEGHGRSCQFGGIPLVPCAWCEAVVQIEHVPMMPDHMLYSTKADDVLLLRKRDGPVPEAIDLPVLKALSQHLRARCHIWMRTSGVVTVRRRIAMHSKHAGPSPTRRRRRMSL